MREFMLVGCGGFAGAVARWALASRVQQMVGESALPVGTLLVNVLGCLAIGLAIELGERTFPGNHFRLLGVIGFLGGFTTFSAFSHETMDLFLRGKGFSAVTYLVASVALCGIGVLFGRKLFHWLIG
ncbi:MAG: fluoride efflux transporter CrcB [Candidatus Eisenbacteria bacterium]|nr:fluoride efflux transporter CrcB [Candidatus Eisenbacteria bacterium]